MLPPHDRDGGNSIKGKQPPPHLHPGLERDNGTGPEIAGWVSGGPKRKVQRGGVQRGGWIGGSKEDLKRVGAQK